MSKPKNQIKPFIPSEDEQGNPVDLTDNPEIPEDESGDKPIINKPEEETPQETISQPEFKIFKTIYMGLTPIPVIIDGKKKYLTFNKHTYRTNDEKEIEALNGAWEEDKDKPFNQRRVLSEDEFLEKTSPERVYVEVDGMNLHVGEIREAIEIAKANGWKPTGKKVFILPNTKSKIMQGGRTASSGGV